MLYVYNNRVVRGSGGRMYSTVGFQLWSQTSTWGGPVPGDDEHVTVPVGETIMLDVNTANLGALTIAGTLIVDTSKVSILLKCKGIHILTTGSLLCASEAVPYGGFNIECNGLRPAGVIVGMTHTTGTDTPTGNPNDSWLGVPGLSRGIIIEDGGRMKLYGTKPALSRTRLNDHAAASATSFTLANNVTWPAGANVYIAPTSFYDNQHTEIFTLASAINNAATMTTNESLAAARWGKLQYITDSGMSLTQGTWTKPHAAMTGMSDEYDQRAKVAMLDRGINIYAPDDTEWQNKRYGVHIMRMGLNAELVLFCVQVRRCGQGGLLGRYPVHSHMASYDSATGATLGDVDGPNNRLENLVVWQSANRGITIHGTRGFIVKNCVSHDCRGHNLFCEDGSEEANQIDGNWFSGARDPQEGVPLDTVTVTTGTPGTFNRTAHGLDDGQCVGISASSMPGGVSSSTGSSAIFYWVVNATANTFQIATNAGGSAIAITSAGTSVKVERIWALKRHDLLRLLEGGASGAWITNANNQFRTNEFFDNAARGVWNAFQYSKKFRSASGGSLFTTGSPGTVNWTAHGLTAGTNLCYSSSGTAATGLTNGQWYTVSATNLATDTFRLEPLGGGTQINITGTGSGTHYLMSSGCFGLSSNVTIIPFFTPPLESGGEPMYSANVCHSNGITGNVLNFAAINERGSIADGSAPTGTLHINGPYFKTGGHAGGTDTLGRFHGFFIWAQQDGGYQNRVVNPWYDRWVQGDNLGTYFFGATQEGFGNKLHAVIVADSLNTLTAPSGYANVKNGMASYHSALDFIGITAIGFSHTTPVLAQNFPYNTYGLLFSRAAMQSWDFYTNPVEMGSGRHEGWQLIDSDPIYRTPPPNIINDLWDTWTGNQPQDGISGVPFRRWTLAAALYTHDGSLTGTPQSYLTYNHPYYTHGLSSSTVQSPSSKMSVVTTDPIYGVKPRADDDGDVGFGDYETYMVWTRLDSTLAAVSGAVMELGPDDTPSTFFGGSRHAGCPRAGYTRLTLPNKGIQDLMVRHVIYNCSRRNGTDGFTQDDFFYLVLDWLGTQACRVLATVGTVGTFPNLDYDASYPGIGRAIEYTSAASLAALQSGAVCAYWRDTANDRIVIKVGSCGHEWFSDTSSPYSSNDRHFDLIVRRP
jgi:G8 domain-containing protein